MQISWYGLGCFQFTARGYPTVVTDPYDPTTVGLRLPQLRADIVTSSQLLADPRKASWPGISGNYRTLAAPGEYEIGGIFITAISSARNRTRDWADGINIVYSFIYDGLVVCHLGELGGMLTQADVESIGGVDVLLVPVGLPHGLTPAEASEVVSMLEPRLVIPMQYSLPGVTLERKSVELFLREMGVAEPEVVDRLSARRGEGAGETRVLLLRPLGQ